MRSRKQEGGRSCFGEAPPSFRAMALVRNRAKSFIGFFVAKAVPLLPRRNGDISVSAIFPHQTRQHS
jgi:hypothetical protein